MRNFCTVTFSLLCFASPALAECRLPSSFLSDSNVQIAAKQINYLVCLHNQQQKDIVGLLDIIRNQEARITELENQQEAVVERLYNLSKEN